MKEMIELFLEKNPRDLAEIESAINLKNYEALNAVAHRMKTSVGFMGLKHLIDPLEKISILAEKKETNSDLKIIFAEIKTECERAYSEFEVFLTSV